MALTPNKFGQAAIKSHFVKLYAHQSYLLYCSSDFIYIRLAKILFQNFRTSSNQPDCKQYKGGMAEATPALEAYVAVLSGGPVGPSDQVGTANVTLIMATWYQN